MIPEQGSLELPGEELGPKHGKTPWVISLVFDKKKLSSKEPWNEITQSIDKNFSEYFEMTEKVGFGQDDPPELQLRGLESIVEAVNKINSAEKDNDKKITVFKYIHDLDEKIRNIFISGIKGLKTVKTSKKLVMAPNSKEEINKEKKKAWEYIVFEVEGTNLRACLSHPKIDPIKTYSNDISEIYNVLGIEAARTAFIN